MVCLQASAQDNQKATTRPTISSSQALYVIPERDCNRFLRCDSQCHCGLAEEVSPKAHAPKEGQPKKRKHQHQTHLLCKNEKSAQRGSFWDGYPADIWGSFARISRPKTSVRAPKMLEKKHLGPDIHDPKARTSTTQGTSKNFGQKNFGLDFLLPNLTPPECGKGKRIRLYSGGSRDLRGPMYPCSESPSQPVEC